MTSPLGIEILAPSGKRCPAVSRQMFPSVLCLAERSGLGVTDPERRERIGEERLTALRAFAHDTVRAG